MRFELVTRDVVLPRAITTARGTWTARRGVLLRLFAADGRVGLGESTPLPGYSPDDAEACAAALARLAPLLEGSELTVPATHDAELADLPCARFALETALADLRAQKDGTSVADVLAGAPAPRHVAVSGLVDLSSAALEAEALALVARGVRTLKAKIGARPRDVELAALARLRSAVGPSIALRLDANGAFDLAGARGLLEDVAPFSPELVEEPTSGAALLDLGPAAVPWAADESLQDARIAARLLASPCAAFVVKPALHGLHAARALALRAAEHGKGVIVTHLFDGPVALAAACELALSLPSAPWACGLDLHPSLALFGPAVVPQLAAGARAMSHRPGLGVELG